MLPQIDGIEVCRRLREPSQVPIIMLTAKDDEIDKVLGLEMGADDYITKPFSMREFRSRVRAALRRAEMLARHDRRRGAARAGDLRIDFERRDGDRARTSRPSSPTSSSRSSPRSRARPGRVYTRDMLLERVWGDSAYRDPRTIDVHIRHLREKLERDPRTPSTCSRCAASATGSGTNDGMRRIWSQRPQQAHALFFAITAGAIRFIYLYVVPQLESNLTSQKLERLEQRRGDVLAAAAGARCARRRPSAQRLTSLVRSCSQRDRRPRDAARHPVDERAIAAIPAAAAYVISDSRGRPATATRPTSWCSAAAPLRQRRDRRRAAAGRRRARAGARAIRCTAEAVLGASSSRRRSTTSRTTSP